MAAYFQQFLSGIGPLLNDDAFTGVVNSTVTPGPTASSAPGEIAFPTDMQSLMALLASLTALGDWLKFIIIGGFFETCRRLLGMGYSKIVNSFLLHATLEHDNACYNWMLVWLSKQPSWGRARNIEISNRRLPGAGGADDSVVELPGADDAGGDSCTARKLRYIPSKEKAYSFWFKGHYMTITRTQDDQAWGRVSNTLHISILARSHSILVELLQEARKAYIAAQGNTLSVYTADSTGDWQEASRRAKRSLDSIILDPGVKELLLGDAKDFLASKDWYTERGIPFRRGYLLYGVPGAGKTSIIHSLAGELKLDIYIISLSRAGLDDSSLDELINELPTRCIAVMEDIDAAFTTSLNRDDNTANENKENTPTASPSSGSPPVSSRVSLSGLLNALDGIGAQEGRILFATTNKYHSLDAALCRPGRMDIHIEFMLASNFQIRELFQRFYIPRKPAEDDPKEEDEDDEEGEDKQDSGYSSAAASTAGDASGVAFVGSRHTSQGPTVSRRRIAKLADRFADVIPERQFSMAALQGYLMMYKMHPAAAVDGALTWAQKELADRATKS